MTGPGITAQGMDAAAALVVLATVAAYANHRLARLPLAVALTLVGISVSVGLLVFERLAPQNGVATYLLQSIDRLDFPGALMDGMLSFLLFAGALHVDWAEMKRGRAPIVVLSTIGVLISTAVVGVGFFGLTRLFGAPLSWAWCLVFGALISPTDPVSVIQVLKRIRISATLEATVAGESLFNDGVGVVVFSILAAGLSTQAPFRLVAALLLFAHEAGGGVVLGLALGWLAIRAMRRIDDYNLEVLISLSVVMGGYAVARPLHVSGPVAMAVAGIALGNRGVKEAMSAQTRDYLLKFWSLIDEILNALLFLLIGLKVVVVSQSPLLILLGAAAVGLTLFARAVSVGAPLLAIRPLLRLGGLAAPTLIWGGLRGGVSVALALGLPPGHARSVVLAATYVVVLFTVIVQGTTIGRLLRRLGADEGPSVPAGGA